jgi:Uma2 family endonuclease
MYRAYTPGVLVGNNSTIRLDMDNAPQPDALMIVDPELGGRAQIDADDYVAGSPEWVGEVSASTASFDLHTKLRVYRRNQVLEYLVWRVLDQAVDWFVLRQGEYERLPLQASGIYQSGVFPGLWLDAAALTRFDLATVYQVLQQGLASPEHQTFVSRLLASPPQMP